MKKDKQNKGLEHIQVEFEITKNEDNGDGFFRFEGLASTFGNIDLVDDIVQQGAFTESLLVKTPIILWQHSHSEPIGMPEEVREVPAGLFLRAKLPIEDDLVKGRVIPQIKVGSIRTMSIGFRIPQGGSFINDDGIRIITKVDLIEISLVTFPANPLAKVTGFKSISPLLEELKLSDDQTSQVLNYIEEKLDLNQVINKEQLEFLDNIQEHTERELEKALRDSGLFSKQAATKLVSFLKRSDSEGNDDTDNEALNAVLAIRKGMEEAELYRTLKSMTNTLEESKNA